MHVIHQRAGFRNLLVDFNGHEIGEPTLVEIAPEVDNGFDKEDDDIVALHVTLLAEKVDQTVVSSRLFIHFRGNRPQLPFRADLVEINGKQFGELLDQVIGRPHGRVEKLTDIPLKEIGITNIDPAEGQVDDQGGQEELGPHGIFIDDFEPDTHIGQVCGVRLDLPVLGNAAQLRRLKPEPDQPLEEEGDERLVLRLDHLQADGLEDLQGCFRIALHAALDYIKDPCQKRLQTLDRLFPNPFTDIEIDLPQSLFVNGFETPGFHDLEAHEGVQVSWLGRVFIGLQFFRELQIEPDHFIEIGQFRQSEDRLSVIGFRLNFRLHDFQIKAVMVMAEGIADRGPGPVGRQHPLLLGNPLAGVVPDQPEFVGPLLQTLHKRPKFPKRGRLRPHLDELRRQPPGGIKAFHEV